MYVVTAYVSSSTALVGGTGNQTPTPVWVDSNTSAHLAGFSVPRIVSAY